jgi:hypothetical protein
MFKYSTIAAALILVGSVAAASAASSKVHRAGVTQIDQYGNYVISHAPGAIPAEPGNAGLHVSR